MRTTVRCREDQGPCPAGRRFPDAGRVRTYVIESRTAEDQVTAVCEATTSVEELPGWLGRTYHAVAQAVATQGASITGPPFGKYELLGERRFAVEAGFPVSAAIAEANGVHTSHLPGGLVVTTVHAGPYEELETAYDALTTWIAEHHGEPTGAPWEVYLTDTSIDPDPARWRTELVQPYRIREA